MSLADKIAEMQAKRNALVVANDEAAEAQTLADLEAIFAIEEERGPSNVKALSVPYDGKNPLPTRCAVRTPDPDEMKRYRDTVKPKRDGAMGDPVKAAEQVADVCRVYPDAETFENMAKARPGLKAQLGGKAVELALAAEESEGKG